MFKNKSLGHTRVVIVCLFLVLAPSLMAQTGSTGAIKGTVTDSSGAVIPNVTVTATNAGTGQSRSATTGADGSYSIPLLPLGSYTVKFEAAGFNPEQVPSIPVNVTETSVLNRTLTVGTQTQQVTVQAEVEEVQTSNATLGTVVGSAAAAGLPLTTRNYTNLLGLSSGANSAVFNATTLGKGSTDIAVNGATTAQNSLLMDGVSITNSETSGVLADNGRDAGIGLVNPDAIQQFKIQTSMFDATYGRNPGASVNVATKSGTNEFHGTAFEFFRNTALNANDFFRNQTPPVDGAPNNYRPVLDQNQYGGVIGGPIKKDKLFFFASFQETSQRNGASAQGESAPGLLPIPGPSGVIGSDRGTSANQAALAAQVGAEFCPGGPDGGNTQLGGTQVSCMGTNINPVALNLLQLKNPDGTYLIQSSSTAVTNTPGASVSAFLPTTFTTPARFTEHQILTNIDYVINSKNTLSAHYFYAYDPTNTPFSCGNSGGTQLDICYPDTALTSVITNHYGILKLTSIVTNHVVNEARASFQRDTFIGNPDNPFTNSQAGIQSIVPAINNLDAITVNGIFTVGSNGTLPSMKWFTNWEVADLVSWTHGKQTLRFGAELENDRYDWIFQALSIGGLTFQTFQDFLIGLPGCSALQISQGCSAANPFPGTNGTPQSNISSSGNNQAILPPGGLAHQYRVPFGDAYVQDDIKITPQFTLNLGLRWEYDSVLYDTYGFASTVWPNLVNTVPIPGSTPATGTLAGFVIPSNWNFQINAAPPVGGVFQNNQKTFEANPTTLHDFAPRLGFAWSPLASNRLAVRGGAGYFYDRVGALSYIGAVEQGEPYSQNVFQNGTANYYSSLAVPYQGAGLVWTPRWVNFNTGATSNIPENAVEPNYRTPVLYEWNLFTQYEFISHWTLELGYVGSRGIHQSGGRLNNEAQLVGNPLGTNDGVAPGIGAGLVSMNTTQNAALRVPYLGFTPAGMMLIQDDADDKFNSVQATLRKEFSHGFQAQAAYTYSRSFNTIFSSNDPNIYQYGPNAAYHPQRLAFSYLWNLPGNYQGLLGKLANGWGWSGVTIVQDGTPLTVNDSRGGTIYGFSAGSTVISRAEYCPGMGAANAASSGSLEQRLGGLNGGQGYFNKAAFYGITPAGGNAGGCATAGATFPTIGNGTGYGDSSLGILLGPGQFNWDMSLTKTTKVGGIHEDATLQFRTEFFNAFNHPQFNNPAGVDVSKSNFGLINSASVNPRLIQFALKYIF